MINITAIIMGMLPCLSHIYVDQTTLTQKYHHISQETYI